MVQIPSSEGTSLSEPELLEGLIEDLLQSVSLPCDPSLTVAYAVDAPGDFLLHTRVADGCGIIEGYPCPNDYVLQLSVANTIEECAGCGLFTCPADLDQNGQVRVTDLIALLGAWGDCPKVGFASRMACLTAELRLHELEIPTDDVIDIRSLKKARLVPARASKVKVILSGKIEKAVKLKGLAVTKGARAAIEAAGGNIED